MATAVLALPTSDHTGDRAIQRETVSAGRRICHYNLVQILAMSMVVAEMVKPVVVAVDQVITTVLPVL